MGSNLVGIIPALSSSDIDKDVAWYESNTGFKLAYKDKSIFDELTAALFRKTRHDSTPPGVRINSDFTIKTETRFSLCRMCER